MWMSQDTSVISENEIQAVRPDVALDIGWPYLRSPGF